MKLRLLTALCVVYVLLLLYGSLMPFDFTAGPEAVAKRLDRAWQCWPFVPDARISGSDALSNLLLYVPLGGLIATRLRLRRNRSILCALILPTAIATATSAAVETLQLFSMTRTASGLDFLLNCSGGLLGACAATACGRPAWILLVRRLRLRWHRRPETLPAAALLVLLAADSLFPFLPTILLSNVNRSLKRTYSLGLAGGLAMHPWHYWLLAKAGVYAALTLLLSAASARRGWRSWLRAASLAACFAAAIEACKPFIISRDASAANVLLAVCGCGAGVLLGPAVFALLSARVKGVLAVAAIGVYIVYVEWQPFAFVWDPAAMRAKLPSGAELLPLYHYAMGARFEDVRLFLRSVVLLAALVYAARLVSRLGGRARVAGIIKAVVVTGFLGLILELGQFLLPTRVPSVTDVFCFALGGALGAWAGVPPALRARRSSLGDRHSD